MMTSIMSIPHHPPVFLTVSDVSCQC